MNQPQVLVGITGGIAAYKTAQVVSLLVQQQVSVQVVMTGAAEQFMGATTFAALSGRHVARQSFQPDQYPLGAHIELAAASQLLLIAPASANFLAQAAAGAAPDLLSTLYLCFRGPVLMAPAMNAAMWEHPATQRNVDRLRQDGVELLGPDAGWLSCREVGAGRMVAPEAIAERVLECLRERGAAGTD